MTGDLPTEIGDRGHPRRLALELPADGLQSGADVGHREICPDRFGDQGFLRQRSGLVRRLGGDRHLDVVGQRRWTVGRQQRAESGSNLLAETIDGVGRGADAEPFVEIDGSGFSDFAADRDRRKGRRVDGVEIGLELGHGDDAIEIPLVVQQDNRDALGIDAVRLEILPQVFERPAVRLPLIGLTVGDEDDAVDPREDGPAGRVVLDLSGYRIQLNGETITADSTEVERQQIEKQRPVRCRVEGVQTGSALRVRHPVDVLQARGLATESRTVVHDLDLDLPILIVELNHRPPGRSATPCPVATSRRNLSNGRAHGTLNCRRVNRNHRPTCHCSLLAR